MSDRARVALIWMLERYVLWCVGGLSPEDAGKMEQVAPGLRRSMGREGNWQAVVAAEMSLPPAFAESVRALWLKQADAPGANAEEFARQFVRANLVPGLH